VFWNFLFKNRNKLAEDSVKSKYRFLFEGYVSYAFFWEFIIVARKIVIVAVVVFLKGDAFRSAYSGVWFLGMALVANVWVQPFENKILQLLETCTLTVLLCSLLLGMLAFADGYAVRPAEQISVTTLVIFLNVLMSLILIICLSYHYYTFLSNNQYMKRIVDVYKRYSMAMPFKRSSTAAPEEELIEMDEQRFNTLHSLPKGASVGVSDHEGYENFSTGPITIDKIKRGRENYKLEFDEQSLRDGFGK